MPINIIVKRAYSSVYSTLKSMIDNWDDLNFHLHKWNNEADEVMNPVLYSLLFMNMALAMIIALNKRNSQYTL